MTSKKAALSSVLILRIIALILIVIQLLGYYGSRNLQHDAINSSVNKLAYYTGFNFFLVIGVILLVISFFIAKKRKKQKEHEMVDSIRNHNGENI